MNYKNWYIWFDAELDEENPKPGTCDIHLQRIGTSTKDADDGFRVLADAKYYGVLRFLAAIGVSHLPEKSRKRNDGLHLPPMWGQANCDVERNGITFLPRGLLPMRRDVRSNAGRKQKDSHDS